MVRNGVRTAEGVSASEDAGTPRSDDLGQSEVFSLVSNRRRRAVIRILSEASGPVDLGTLADEIACAERETSLEDLDPDDRQNVYVSLYQSHVPKLAEAGVVDYDRDSNVIVPRDSLEQVAVHLRQFGDDDVSEKWIDYHVVGMVLSVGFWVIQLLPLLPGYTLFLHAMSVLSCSSVVASQLLNRVKAHGSGRAT